MAFLEWRRFNFFDLHKQADGGKVKNALQDTKLTAAVSGNSHVVFCDDTGYAHIVSRTWEIISFKAYEITVTLAQQYQFDQYLVTVGDDEEGINPMLKVWDWNRTDRHGNPVCVRVSRVIQAHTKLTQPTALAINHENKNMVALGFFDGSVNILKGDITRQRSSKISVIQDTGTTPIIHLAFKGSQYLFISSRTAVNMWNLVSEKLTMLDSVGGPAVFANNNYMVAKPDAIYCYTPEGRGPCYALKGEKKRLDWFRSYLVITMTDNEDKQTSKQTTDNIESPGSNHLTILDIQNKFIVFSMTFDKIEAILTEWGSFYILTQSKEMLYLDEKDLKSKLHLLFKKNLFDVAIRIASSQQYDDEGLTEIYKQYGDHLYAKGDLKGAIDQYIKTIGRLETSYVIRKYLDCRHMEHLINYLQELHVKGLATEDHSILLMTCYVKLDQYDQQGKLKKFLQDQSIDVNVDIAIKVCRTVSVDDAILFAFNNKRHDWYLRMMIEDKKSYTESLDYISKLDSVDAEQYIRKYGNILIQHAPKETTNFLKALCTNKKYDGNSEFTLYPDEYVHMFVNNSEYMVDFLEHMIKVKPDSSKTIYNTLIEHYIHVWNKLEGESEKSVYEEKILELLGSPTANYDRDQTLIVCQMLGFKPGTMLMYEENKMWRAAARAWMRAGNTEKALAVCRRRGAIVPTLWVDLLSSNVPSEYLHEILNVIGNQRLMSPLMVIDTLSSGDYKLGDIRKYLKSVLEEESETLNKEQKLYESYRNESRSVLQHVKQLRTEPIIFQRSRCAACHHTLELPSVHFFCQHSYHQHEREGRCPACSPTHTNTKRQASLPAPAEALHARLNKEPDPFGVVSEYFGRGLFNKLTVITEAVKAETILKDQQTTNVGSTVQVSSSYGAGAEARLRLAEGESKQMYTLAAPKHTGSKGPSSVIPIPEGRMRVLEQRNYSTSLEANIKRRHIDVPGKSSPTVSENSPLKKEAIIGRPEPNSVTQVIGTNPFGDENEKEYNDAKNPFAEDEDISTGNPFSDTDDYDANLNPFS